MDILRTTELYTSQLKTDSLRAEDPVTTNLIAALVAVSISSICFYDHYRKDCKFQNSSIDCFLQKGPPSAIMPRRSSNEAAAAAKKKPAKKSALVSLPTSKELREALKKISCWDFDILLVEKLSSGK